MTSRRPGRAREATPAHRLGTALVVFTADLRVHDHPALAAAARHEQVVPAFVLDDALLAHRDVGVRRRTFLRGSLLDLDGSLRRLGSALVVRRGEWVREVLALAGRAGATVIHVSDAATPYGRRRLDALEAAAADQRVSLHRHSGPTVVPPGELRPSGRSCYQVFTPFHRQWRAASWRDPVPCPRVLPPLPRAVAGDGLDRMLGALPPTDGRGGETRGRRRLGGWLRHGLAEYAQRDRLVDPATSRLSAYLHLGCLSPLEVALAAADEEGAEPYLRQLSWRDFFLQLAWARPAVLWKGFRAQAVEDSEPGLFERWQEGRTGYPVVDAAMRQLRSEGHLSNRARMVVGSFLTHDLRIGWRRGARHFLQELWDGDVVVNNLNWQWLAGVGTDRSPVRAFSPLRQGLRFDPEATFVRRHVPELRSLSGRAAHDPDPATRRRLGYPAPVVDHRAATRPGRRPVRGSQLAASPAPLLP